MLTIELESRTLRCKRSNPSSLFIGTLAGAHQLWWRFVRFVQVQRTRGNSIFIQLASAATQLRDLASVAVVSSILSSMNGIASPI